MATLITLREMGRLYPWITHKDKLGDSQPSKKKISIEKPTLGKTLELGLKV